MHQIATEMFAFATIHNYKCWFCNNIWRIITITCKVANWKKIIWVSIDILIPTVLSLSTQGNIPQTESFQTVATETVIPVNASTIITQQNGGTSSEPQGTAKPAVDEAPKQMVSILKPPAEPVVVPMVVPTEVGQAEGQGSRSSELERVRQEKEIESLSNKKEVCLVFSSPEPKARVSYCHSASSVVRPSVVVRRPSM